MRDRTPGRTCFRKTATIVSRAALLAKQVNMGFETVSLYQCAGRIAATLQLSWLDGIRVWPILANV